MTNMTTSDIAAELGTTPRELRKFLRSDFRDKGVETPGKGSRYQIARKDLRGLRTRFNAWSAAKEEARNARTAPETDTAPVTDDAPTAPETDIEDETPISLDELEGPTEDELLNSLDED